ncbi:MAG: hypothetical protein KGI67_05245 [Pseudomonadota bacterium]|nr:hypothetical protein [Pseudomonadota bacterium]
MSKTLDELLARMRALEEEVEAEFAARRKEIAFAIENRRIRFPLDVLNRHRLQRIGLWTYLRNCRIAVALTAPILYTGVIPFVLMDLFVTLYQRLCFPIYGIPRVRRRDYLVFDRAELPYLNAIEKFNCFYCSYANGVAAYLREVGARTEQYWCPIKHARRMLGSHARYAHFYEFGDAESYRRGLERLRSQYELPAANGEQRP